MDLAMFLTGVTSKTKLIILMISRGYTFDNIRSLSVAELQEFRSNIPDNLPELLDICDDICADKSREDRAFTNTSGRLYSIKNISDILHRAHTKAGIQYQGREHFLFLLRAGQ